MIKQVHCTDNGRLNFVELMRKTFLTCSGRVHTQQQLILTALQVLYVLLGPTS